MFEDADLALGDASAQRHLGELGEALTLVVVEAKQDVRREAADGVHPERGGTASGGLRVGDVGDLQQLQVLAEERDDAGRLAELAHQGLERIGLDLDAEPVEGSDYFAVSLRSRRDRRASSSLTSVRGLRATVRVTGLRAVAVDAAAGKDVAIGLTLAMADAAGVDLAALRTGFVERGRVWDTQH